MGSVPQTNYHAYAIFLSFEKIQKHSVRKCAMPWLRIIFHFHQSKWANTTKGLPKGLILLPSTPVMQVLGLYHIRCSKFNLWVALLSGDPTTHARAVPIYATTRYWFNMKYELLLFDWLVRTLYCSYLFNSAEHGAALFGLKSLEISTPVLWTLPQMYLKWELMLLKVAGQLVYIHTYLIRSRMQVELQPWRPLQDKLLNSWLLLPS